MAGKSNGKFQKCLVYGNATLSTIRALGMTILPAFWNPETAEISTKEILLLNDYFMNSKSIIR